MEKKTQDFAPTMFARLQQRLTRRQFGRSSGMALAATGVASVFGAERIAHNQVTELLHELGPHGGIVRELRREEIDDNILADDELRRHAKEGMPASFQDAVDNRDYDVIRQYVRFEEATGDVDAACIPGSCRIATQCRCSDTCNEPYDRTFTQRSCCAACGCGWLYYDWLAGGCTCQHYAC